MCLILRYTLTYWRVPLDVFLIDCSSRNELHTTIKWAQSNRILFCVRVRLRRRREGGTYKASTKNIRHSWFGSRARSVVFCNAGFARFCRPLVFFNVGKLEVFWCNRSSFSFRKAVGVKMRFYCYKSKASLEVVEI